MKRKRLCVIENEIVQLIQTKNQIESLGKLDWTTERVLNNSLIDEVSKLKKILRKERNTEPHPALFTMPTQQPPKPIEFYF